MSVLYADTSAVIRTYFADEADHAVLRKLLIDGVDPVITSELTRLELASAVTSATRAKRITDPRTVLDQFDADCGADGPYALLRLNSSSALSLARELVIEHRLRAADALHLAVLLSDGLAVAGGEPVILVTRDVQQAEAAKELGLSVL